MYIVKLSSNGTLQWSRTVGGTDEDQAFSILQTKDRGFAVAGFTVSFGLVSTHDMYIVKFDSNWNTCGNSALVFSSSDTLGTINPVTPTVTSPTSVITSRTPFVGSGGTLTTVCISGIQP